MSKATDAWKYRHDRDSITQTIGDTLARVFYEVVSDAVGTKVLGETRRENVIDGISNPKLGASLLGAFLNHCLGCPLMKLRDLVLA